MDMLLEIELDDEVSTDYELGRSNYILEVEKTDSYLEFSDWSVKENMNVNKYTFVDTGDECCEDDTNKCSFCTKTFLEKKDLYKHNLKHLKIVLPVLKTKQCMLCNQPLLSQTSLKSHLTSVHMNIENPQEITDKTEIICPICLTTCKNYRYWYEHVSTVHSKEQIKCDTCNVTFKCKRYYVRHACVRDPETYYKRKFHMHTCKVCLKLFPNKTSLYSHFKNIHYMDVKKSSKDRQVLSELPLECNFCGSVFKNKHYLNSHRDKVHVDTKKITCGFCGKKYMEKIRLNIHINNAHMSPKSLHKCIFCSKVFKSLQPYEKHFKNCSGSDIVTIESDLLNQEQQDSNMMMFEKQHCINLLRL